MKRILQIVISLSIIHCCTSRELLSSFQRQLVQQRELISEIQSRVQVSSFSYSGGGISIVLGDGQTYYLSGDYTPVLYIIDNYWAINGERTLIVVDYLNDGFPKIPVLTIGADHNWLFDGVNSGIKAKRAHNHLQSEISYIIYKGKTITIVYVDGSFQDLSIISDPNLLVPDYYISQLRQKEDYANEAILEAGKDQASFVFFTDAHWGQNSQHSPALIQHILDNTSVHRVLFGGDVITTKTSTVQEAIEIGESFKKSFSFLGNKLYCLYGNHDNNSDEQPNNVDLHLTEQQVYSYLQSQMDNVYYWDYYNYYFDDTVSKTRYICLDTGRLYYSQFRDASIRTVQFLIETLDSVPSGWHIIMASHIWCGLQNEDGEKKCVVSSYVKPIIAVLDDYNSRTSGVFKYLNESVYYDFSGGKGTIEFCIGGHNHRDGVVISEGKIPIVILTTDSWQTINGEIAKSGSISEQAVSIVVADYHNHKLSVFRVGRGEDISFPL